MNRTTAVTVWREVCGSDAGMAPTGRMLEDFASRIEAAEREQCAKLCDEAAGRLRASGSNHEASAVESVAEDLRG